MLEIVRIGMYDDEDWQHESKYPFMLSNELKKRRSGNKAVAGMKMADFLKKWLALDPSHLICNAHVFIFWPKPQHQEAPSLFTATLSLTFPVTFPVKDSKGFSCK